jgi:hypothetical protein
MSILDVSQKISDIYNAKYNKDIEEIKTVPDNGSSTTSKPIKYSIEKLLGTGFSLRGNMISEIEKTMDLCEEFII